MYDSHYLCQKMMQREERNIIKSKGETDGEGERDAVILIVRSHGWLQEFKFLNLFILFAIFYFLVFFVFMKLLTIFIYYLSDMFSAYSTLLIM